MNPKWQFKKIKQLQNDCSIIEFCVQNLNKTEDCSWDWHVIGCFIILDSLYDALYEEGGLDSTIQRFIEIR